MVNLLKCQFSPNTDILFDVLDENIAFCTIVILPFSARKNGLRINGVPQPCKGGRPSRYFNNDPNYIIGKSCINSSH